MIGSRQGAVGDHAVQIAGSGNSYNATYYTSGRPLPPSKIFELLERVYDAAASQMPHPGLSDPEPMKQKLIYNRASRHIGLFREVFEDIHLISEVAKDFPDSERIMGHLAIKFGEVAEVDENGNRVVGDGDEQLMKVRSEIGTLLESGQHPEHPAFCAEEIERFSLALTAYGVQACKVLINPNEGAVG